MPLPKDILAYNAAQTPGNKRLCDALAKQIHAALSAQEACECKVWHRHPVWFLDGNPIVGYNVLKGDAKGNGRCVRLLFWSGQSFDEPEGSPLMPDPPDTKFKSAGVRFTAASDISTPDLARWLEQSIHTQWDYKNIVKRKGKLERLK